MYGDGYLKRDQWKQKAYERGGKCGQNYRETNVTLLKIILKKRI